MRCNRLVVRSVFIALCALCLAGCDKVKDWIGWKKGGGFARKSEVTDADKYDKVALKRKFGEPHEATEKFGWVKEEHGFRYNNKWIYYHRKQRDSKELIVRMLYFIDDKFQGSVVIGENGRARREKVALF